MGEYLLVAFTICLQASIGIMLFMTLMQQILKGATFRKAAYACALLAVAGLFFSLIKLGQPFSSYNAILNVGSSWLSREILFAGGFAVIAVAYAAALKFEFMNENMKNALLWVGSLLGLVAVFVMARVYTFSIVPAWNSPNVYVDFLAAAVTMGGVLFWAFSTKELAEASGKILALTILAVAIIQVSVAVPYLVGLALESGTSAVTAAILSNMGIVLFFRWLLVLVGAGALMLPSVVARKSTAIVYGAAVVLIVGQVLGRYVFYASGIIPGIG